MHKRHYLLLFIVFLFSLALTGCGSQTENKSVNIPKSTSQGNDSTSTPKSTSQENKSVNTPTSAPERLDETIIGLWERHDDAGSFSTLDFTANGTLISGHEIVPYEVISEYTILAIVDDTESIIRVRDLQNDTFTFETDGTETTYNRVEGIDNISEVIIGLWMHKDEYNNVLVIEFAPNGTYISNESGIGRYNILSSNSIEIFFQDYQQDNQYERNFWRITDATANTLTINFDLTFTRVEGHNNLTERIIGLWRAQDGAELEITASGYWILDYKDVIEKYEVISNNTIFVNEEGGTYALNVFNLTDETMQLIDFGAFTANLDDYRTYSRVR